MTDEQYNIEKGKILTQTKNKGLDLWEKVLGSYGIDIEKAKTAGVYIPRMNSYYTLYFDQEQDRWMIKPTLPEAN
jgi:hypothetical protein